MRVALYWAPALDDPLWQAGSRWLGRDAELGIPLEQPSIDGIAAATAPPRVYGLHATLRPPMRLATDWAAFMHAAREVADATAPFDLPPLAVRDFGGFVALREVRPCLALRALADACVRATDPHRRPPDAAELAHRRGAGLTEEQDALLLRWGYPHVMHHWRFHVTLTRRLDAATMARLLPAAEAYLAPALARARRVRELAVFTQREEGGAFLVAERLALKEGLLF